MRSTSSAPRRASSARTASDSTTSIIRPQPAKGWAIISGVDQIQSQALDGFASIQVIFVYGVDPKAAAQDIRDVVSAVYGPVALELVVEYLRALESIRVIEMVK